MDSRTAWPAWSNGLYAPVEAEITSRTTHWARTRFAVPKVDLAPLLALRLTSRSLCASATRIMARHCDWTLGLEKAKLDRALAGGGGGGGGGMLAAISNLTISSLWYLRTFDRNHGLDADL